MRDVLSSASSRNFCDTRRTRRFGGSCDGQLPNDVVVLTLRPARRCPERTDTSMSKPNQPDFPQQVAALEQQWANDPRWSGVERTYGAADVIRLRGSVTVEHSLARQGSERLWELLQSDDYI